VKQLQEKLLPKLQQYEEQEALLAGRNSYSKTDPDATFMRTKDDHLGKGQLKPCYNIQLGTQDQFIINYTTHRTSSDIAAFIDHMDDTLNLLEKIQVPKPKRVCGDAGYGSEQNYEYLEDKGIEAFLKYPGYYKEQTSSYGPFHLSNLYYNETDDYYVCPMGQHMTLQRITKEKSSTGYEQQIHVYQAKRCEGCPLLGVCHRSQENRIIKVNRRAAKYRQEASQRLASLQGILMRSQRGVDTEPVFGHFKQDRHFRRFTLTGEQGVSTETGLLAIAHNLKKWWAKLCKHRSIVPLPPTNSMICAQVTEKSGQIDLNFEKIRA